MGQSGRAADKGHNQGVSVKQGQRTLVLIEPTLLGVFGQIGFVSVQFRSADRTKVMLSNGDQTNAISRKAALNDALEFRGGRWFGGLRVEQRSGKRDRCAQVQP